LTAIVGSVSDVADVCLRLYQSRPGGPQVGQQPRNDRPRVGRASASGTDLESGLRNAKPERCEPGSAYAMVSAPACANRDSRALWVKGERRATICFNHCSNHPAMRRVDGREGQLRSSRERARDVPGRFSPRMAIGLCARLLYAVQPVSMLVRDDLRDAISKNPVIFREESCRVSRFQTSIQFSRKCFMR
jgi:hypothetical protein